MNNRFHGLRKKDLCRLDNFLYKSLKFSFALLFALTCLIATTMAEGDGIKIKPDQPPNLNGWKPVGLSGGGALFSPAISGLNPDVMMIASNMSGAYISHDGGNFWQMIPHLELSGNIHCPPSFHPHNENIIYAPHGWSGKTLKISIDRGRTWKVLAQFSQGLYGSIAIDADNPSLMLAGFKKSIMISRDGGKQWENCHGPTGKTLAFHIDRTTPEQQRTLFAATKKGIWRSIDGGDKWIRITSGLPWNDIIAFAGGSNRTTGRVILYCVIPGRKENGKYCGGIYRSDDRGGQWKEVMGPGINRDLSPADKWAQSKIASYTHLLTSDEEPQRVYALNRNTGFWPPHHTTVFRSDDGGNNWRSTLFLDPRFSAYNVQPNYHTATLGSSFQESANGAAICPTDPDRIVRCGSMLAQITYDGGETWHNSHTLPAGTASLEDGISWRHNGLGVTTSWHYYIDPFQSDRHYIAYTDIGLARSVDGGDTWIWWDKKGRTPWPNTCYELAFDPQVPGKIWGAFSNLHDIPNGNIILGRRRQTAPGGICLSTDFGKNWLPLGKGLPVAPATAIVVDPESFQQARTLYAGFFDHGIFKSVNGGLTWSSINNGLGSKENKRVCRLLLHQDGILFALVTGKVQHSKFLASGVGLYKSQDQGQKWQNITADLDLLWTKDFCVHPTDSNIIFLGAADAGKQKQGGLYRTLDAGRTWKKLIRKGPEHFGAYFHPKRPDWLYMTLCEEASGPSLFLSTDNGETWLPFPSFPFANAQRIIVDPHDPEIIYVTTFGGGVFKGSAEMD